MTSMEKNKDPGVREHQERIRKELGWRAYFASKTIAESIGEYLTTEPTRESASNLVDSFGGLLLSGNALNERAAKVVMDVVFDAGKPGHLEALKRELGNRGGYSESLSYATGNGAALKSHGLTIALDALFRHWCFRETEGLLDAARREAKKTPLESVKRIMDCIEGTYGHGSEGHFDRMYYLTRVLYEKPPVIGAATESVGIREGLFEAAIQRENSRAGKAVALIGESFRKQGMTEEEIPEYVKAAPRWARELIEEAVRKR